MSALPRPRWSLPATALALALSTGCEGPKNVAASRPPAPAKAPEDNFIVGKRTQDVGKLDRQEEVKKGGTVASTRIVARDPITLSGNAYVTMIGKTSILQIEQAINLFKAANDRYPKDYDEFMAEIIKANNIALPRLPHYQKYNYDEKEHKLVLIEYPDLKDQPPQ